MTIAPRTHWTPRYVVDRVRLELDQRRWPDHPWWTRDAIAFLSSWIRPGDICVEWGAGRSTLWLDRRGVSVRSVEHDPIWADSVTTRFSGRSMSKVLLVDPDSVTAYVRAVGSNEGPVDIAIVDGLHRGACASLAAQLVKPGGLVVVDNVERYLPSPSRSPESRGSTPVDADWVAFVGAVTHWRHYWTSNGVTDTCIWFRPTE